ncbi:MAG: ATP phosphoribosyltransferase regulatory subunit, partial [Sphingomonadales bacterium]|nr:ATP phosphoribosyltransferase regulatory subunit [Sphingomonadales bacterium]
KDPRDKAFVTDAPKIDNFLSSEAKDFFAKVTGGLDSAGVAWTRAPSLVRGLDYYRHTAFEFVTDRLGAQGTVLGGGRYDGLMESLGGPHTPAVGWAAGIERLAMLVGERQDVPPTVVVVSEHDERNAVAAAVAAQMRRAGVAVELIANGSPRKRFDRARKLEPAAIVSFDVRDGQLKHTFRSLSPGAELAGKIFEQYMAELH